jgi:hypothetical protein
MTAQRKWTLLTLALLMLVATPRVRNVVVTFPYVMFDDEQHLTENAREMVRTGDLDPHWYRYPTLPIYLTAAALWVGTAVTGEDDPGRTIAPYYEKPEVVIWARLAFAAIGVIAMLLAGLAAARAFGRAHLTALTLVALSASSLVLRHSWSYNNVDIIGAAVCMGALAYLQATWQRTGLLHRAVIPGLFTGAAVASKYYLGLVGAPFLLALWWTERRPRNLAVIVLATVVGFVTCMPYSVLSFEAFTVHLERELHHYAEGHGSAVFLPGWMHLRVNLEVVFREFGVAGCALILLGLAQAWRRAARRAWLLLLFPLALLLFLSAQQVHFDRNLLSVLFAVGGLLALGVDVAGRWVLERRGWKRWGAGLALGAAVLVAMPWSVVAPEWTRPVDSRRRALEWVATNVPAGVEIAVAEEAHTDPRPLRETHEVREMPLERILLQRVRGMAGRGEPLVVILPPPGWSSPEDDSTLVRQRARLELAVRFGSRPVPDNKWLVRRWGDPLVEVLLLD